MGMRFGVGLPTGGVWSTAENLFAVARLAEELGYTSVWTSQRVLYPTSPVDPFPFAPDRPWPAAYRNAVDPLVALAAVAARTSTVRLGVGAVVAPFYSPPVLAKQVATLDLISGGRFDLGIVPGWSRDEFAAAGQPFAERGRITDEIVAALRAMFTGEVTRFAGQRFDIPDSIFEPKPVQSPSIPLLIGGYGAAAIRRIARYGDGYIAGQLPVDQWLPLVKRIADRVALAGRDPSKLRFVCRCNVRLQDRPAAAHRRFLEGTADQIRGDLARYEESGVTDLVVELNLHEDVTVLAPSAEVAYRRAEAVLRALAPGVPSHE